MQANTRRTFRHFARMIVFLLTAMLCVSPSLLAQQRHSEANLAARQISLTLEDAPLSTILRTFSEQTGYGVLVDGEPLLTKASFDLHTSAKDALDQVAERFDCSWTLSKQGVILMNKRFRKAGDLPQMALADMHKMAADLLRIWPVAPSDIRLHYYPYIHVQIYPANALFQAFTSQQRQLLQSGQQLTYQVLTPQQQSLVRLGVYNGAIGTSRDVWEQLNARLTAMPGGYVQWRPWFMNRPEVPDPEHYSLDYIWSDPQDRGYVRLLTPEMIEQMQEKILNATSASGN